MYLCMPGLAERYQLGVLAQPDLQNSMRLSRIRDSIVLVAGSREPMVHDGMEKVIRNDVVDHAYEHGLAGLAAVAARNSQTGGKENLGIQK